MNETRNFGTQCETKRSTGVQTKRLGKDEMRYYSKIIDKEKQVLLKFVEVTKGDLLPYYKLNTLPMQSGHKTKALKNCGGRKRQKRKNKRKHSSPKIKHGPSPKSGVHQDEENVENGAHYVSKIVVDDNARSLKLSLKSCNPKKSSSSCEFKENDWATKQKERTRSRKAKRPRRVYRVPEHQPQLFTMMKNNENSVEIVTRSPEDRLGKLSPTQRPLSPKKEQAVKTVVKPESTEKSDCFGESMNVDDKQSNSVTMPINGEYGFLNQSAMYVKKEEKKSSCLVASVNAKDKQTDHSIESTNSEDDTSNYRGGSTNSENEESDCSEEFSIVEPSEPDDDKATELSDGNTLIKNQEEEVSTIPNVTLRGEKENSADASMRNELKKRLKANLIRKQVENNQDENRCEKEEGINMSNPGSGVRVEEGEGLPQVVSVHFYDPQNRCQRVIDPNTQITQYARRDGTHVMLNDPVSPSNSLSPPLHPTDFTPPDHFRHQRKTPSRSPPGSLLHQALPQTTLTNGHPVQYSYPPYYQHVGAVHKQSPTVPSTIDTNNMRTTSYQSPYPMQGIPSNISAEMRKTPPTSTDSTPKSTPTNANSTTQTINKDSELEKNKTPETPETPENDEKQSEPRGEKRKRFIFGSHEPPKKKVISSLLTPLCEREATRLADGIHEINMQYFPLRSLAQKAANRASEHTDDVLKLIDQKIQLKTKIQDVEKARNLLKDIYDMVLKSKEIEDIQNFELVSHNFGVRNILNHLSLVDLYFGELGSELQSKI